MGNCSLGNFPELQKTNVGILDNFPFLTLFSIYIFTLLRVFGIIGNIFICIIIVINTHMHTSMNCYLFSLAISDILTALSFLYTESFNGWGGIVVVQLNIYSCNTALTASVMILLAITMDRYIAVCHPFIARSRFSFSRNVKIILIIWISSLMYNLALIQLCYELVDQSCNEKLDKGNILITLNYILSFVIPFIILTTVYALIGLNIWRSSRTNIGNKINFEKRQSSSKKGILLSVSVIAEFFICQGPMHVIKILALYHTDFSQAGWNVFLFVAITLYFLSSIIDPIIYGFVSSTFRKAYKDLLWSGIKRCKEKCSTRQKDDVPVILEECNK